ncbi:DUF4255 domain-containing protein [Sphingobium rhizovicinum]|uniref:DUF4255 domain-containing protein n=1 Tax=Sphingobium rhizovicinum TaxID=432308 RepID=A0ABV7NMZ1_9SPHN
MLSHALTIVSNELNRHLTSIYGGAATQVKLGNIAEGVGTASPGALPRDVLGLSMVNIREEKALKNGPGYVRNDASMTVLYQNPPLFLNFHILIVATHSNYSNALLMLSRALQFFQYRNLFTQDVVAPASLTTNAPANALDQLASFKIGFDLCSPTMEEVNHLWGTLGGKQYPFALYALRVVEMQFKAVESESGLITEVVNDVRQTIAVAG